MNKFFEAADKLKPIYDTADKIILFICKICLVLDILITCFSVLGRYVPFIPDPAWTEEIILMLMTYMAVLSAALAIRKKSHIRMSAFDRYLPSKLIRVLDILDDICVLILAVVMLVVGMNFALRVGSHGVYVSMPFLSRFWKYFPIPVAGLAMIVFELEALYQHFKSLVLGGKEAK